MRTNFLRLIAFILLYPYIVGFTSDSTSVNPWSVLFGFGGGSYSVINRDCNGNVLGSAKIPFNDFGAGVEYSEKNILVGVKTGIHSASAATLISRYPGASGPAAYDTTYYSASQIVYANPYAGLKFRYFEFRIGGLFAGGDIGGTFNLNGETVSAPSGYIRVGSEKGFLVSASLFNNLPLMSAGGIFDMGIGVCLNEQTNTSLWGGVGILDLENSGTIVKYSTTVFDDYFLTFTGGIGEESKSAMLSVMVKTKLNFW